MNSQLTKMEAGSSWEPWRVLGSFCCVFFFSDTQAYYWVVATQFCLYFHPENWGNDPIWRAYFSDGLVQPPTRHTFVVGDVKNEAVILEERLGRNDHVVPSIYMDSELESLMEITPQESHHRPDDAFSQNNLHSYGFRTVWKAWNLQNRLPFVLLKGHILSKPTVKNFGRSVPPYVFSWWFVRVFPPPHPRSLYMYIYLWLCIYTLNIYIYTCYMCMNMYTWNILLMEEIRLTSWGW